VALHVLGLVLGLGLVHVKRRTFTCTLLSFTSFVHVLVHDLS
jgi:hypothetical protein